MKKKLFCYLVFVLINVNANLYAQIITTIAGGATGHGGYWGDEGPATAAEISTFGGLAVDASGNIYIADGNNQRIRKVDAITGIITTVAGNGIAGYSGDGVLATNTQLNNPSYVAVDPTGNLYIGDGINYRIRKVDATTSMITTFAGNGTAGFSGDHGPATAAQVMASAIACDAFGNLYLSDAGNRRIRKVNATGIITTIAGNGISGITGDGGLATAATVNGSLGLCTDAYGNVYLQDSSQSVRKINVSTGIITRVAGTGDNTYSPYTGDGLAATVSHIGPMGITTDNIGNLYIADYSNSRIEKVDTFGIIYTVVGIGISGFSGDTGPATAAELGFPEGVAIDACGNIYIADFNNKRVRKVTYPTVPTSLSISGPITKPIGSIVTINAAVTAPGSGYTIKWMNHGIVFTTTYVPSVTYTKGIEIGRASCRERV